MVTSEAGIPYTVCGSSAVSLVRSYFAIVSWRTFPIFRNSSMYDSNQSTMILRSLGGSSFWSFVRTSSVFCDCMLASTTLLASSAHDVLHAALRSTPLLAKSFSIILTVLVTVEITASSDLDSRATLTTLEMASMAPLRLESLAPTSTRSRMLRTALL